MVTAKITQLPAEEMLGNVAAVKAHLVLNEGLTGPDTEILPGDEDLWILGQELIVLVDEAQEVVVQVGFTTDGASIPELAQTLTSWDPWEPPQRWAGIAHDWLYHQRGYDRRRADKVFRAILRSKDAGLVKTTLMYRAVRLFGRKAYERNQRWGWRSKIYRPPEQG